MGHISFKIFLLSTFVLTPALASASCPQKGQLEKLQNKLNSYKPPSVGLGGGGGSQSGNTGQAGQNSGQASAALQKCAGDLNQIAEEFDSLKEKMNSENCSKEKESAEEGKRSAEAKAGQCSAAGANSDKQGDKNKDNEKKMGEGGSPPQMPQMPQKKEDKKDDQKLQQCLARLAGCRNGVTSNLEIKKKNCEINIPYDPSHPIAQQKQKQDECKQSQIFSSQGELAQCEATNPCGTGSTTLPGVDTSPASTVTATNTATSTATSSSSGSRTSTNTSGITK